MSSLDFCGSGRNQDLASKLIDLVLFSLYQTVEREISFRTEAGLFFSYYKTIVTAPSINEGLRRLMYDNVTEAQRTINIIQRFNIYQEVVLGVMYKSMPLAWQVIVILGCSILFSQHFAPQFDRN